MAKKTSTTIDNTTESRFKNLDTTDRPAVKSAPVKPSRNLAALEIDATPPKNDSKPNAKVFGTAYGMGAGDKKAGRDKDGTMRNSLGLESSETHRHVALEWQKKCRPWSALEKLVADQDAKKLDLSAQRSKVTVVPISDREVPSLFLSGVEDKPIKLTDHAVRSVLEFTNVPWEMARYLMAKGYPDQLAIHINRELGEHCTRNGDKDFLVRTREEKALDGSEHRVARYVGSDRYSVIDNTEVLTMLKEEFPEITKSLVCGGKADQMMGLITDDPDRLRANFLIPDSMKAKPDSDYGVGIAIQNSEVGDRAFELYGFLFRAICLNGSVRRRQDSSVKARQRHQSAPDIDAIRKDIKLSVEVALTEGWLMLDRYEDAREVEVDVRKMIVRLSRDNRVGIPQAQDWAKAWALEPGQTAWHVMQGLTRAAQEQGPDTRSDMEMLAGRLLAPSVLDCTSEETIDHWDHLNRHAKSTPTSLLDRYLPEAVWKNAEEQSQQYVAVRN